MIPGRTQKKKWVYYRDMTIVLAMYSYFHKEHIVKDLKAKCASGEVSDEVEEYDGNEEP